MMSNRTILLDDYYENFVNNQVQSGNYNSKYEVLRAALILFEKDLIDKQLLENELIKGENSGYINNFDKNEFIVNLNSV